MHWLAVFPSESDLQIGIDIETQIEEGELFDFDTECEPVLEAILLAKKAFASRC